MSMQSGSRRKLIGRVAGGLAVALLATGAVASPALADNDRHRGWNKGHHRYYGPPGHVKKHYTYVQPYTYHYVAPSYVYAPPPVAYVPAPVYRPSPSVTVTIPFDF